MEPQFEADWEKRFTCPHCMESHSTKAQALKCCPQEVESFFQCNGCFGEFETKKEAQECCGVWSCGWCGEEFDNDKAGAAACCKDQEDLMGDHMGRNE